MSHKNYISYSPQQTQHIAKQLVQELQGGAVVALYGDLGAGKTTFTQGLAKALGIEKRIISPTFVVVRQYRIKNKELRIKNLFHIDLYRTETEKDIDNLGLEEIFNDPGAIVVIEWAEKAKNFLPKATISITFTHIDDSSRKITMSQIIPQQTSL